MQSESRVHTRIFAVALLSLLALACEAFPGRGRVRVPDVSVSNVTSGTMQGFESTVRIDLRISNPNPFPLQIDGLRFQLDLNGRRFARGQTDQVVEIPRLGDASVSLDVRTGLGDMLRQIPAVNDTDFKYTIEGELFLTSPQDTILPFEFESESWVPAARPSATP
jgi:LEA14-like dessication related protein